jgi:hypothetical protein
MIRSQVSLCEEWLVSQLVLGKHLDKESHDRAGKGLWHRRSGGGKVKAAAKSGSCMVSTVDSSTLGGRDLRIV